VWQYLDKVTERKESFPTLSSWVLRLLLEGRINMNVEKILIEEQAKFFIEKLPAISFDIPTLHLLMLGARSRRSKKKYNIKIKDMMFERKFIRPVPNWREIYFEKIYNLAVLQTSGKYYYKNIYIASDCLGIFGTVNPRNVNSAVSSLISQTFDIVFQTKSLKQDKAKKNEKEEYIDAKEDSEDEEDVSNDGDISNEGKSKENSEKQSTKYSRNHYISRFDVKYFGRLHRYAYRDQNNLITIDIDDPTIYPEIRDMLSPMKIWMITKTARGYHIILDP
jgi:hypothetical protein